MRRKEPITPDQYYHIYNRGVNRQNIFFTKQNWLFFLRRLRHYATPELATIIAYCLMPNHYHLLLFVTAEEFGKQVMQPFMVSYTKAINKQESRTGALFQGPFQARRVAKERDLIHLTRYIHLNPVTAGFVARPEDWPYSSYPEYVGIREGTLPHPEVILGMINPRNPIFGKNRVSQDELFDRQKAYADFVGNGHDPRAGLVDSLLMD